LSAELPTALIDWRIPAAAQSLTWDQGGEMARHVELKIAAGIEVYFCDPHSPWQRPSNKNTNGLLRQYFPKGTDLSRWSTEEIAAIAATLNARPRKVLGWRTPAEVYQEQLQRLKCWGLIMVCGVSA
jgi:IS30 family transposase